MNLSVWLVHKINGTDNVDDLTVTVDGQEYLVVGRSAYVNGGIELMLRNKTGEVIWRTFYEVLKED